MNYLLIIGSILVLIGIAGSIIPALPGLMLSFIALLLLFFTKGAGTISVSTLVVFGIIAAVLLVLDFVAPIIGAKFFGSTKYGLIGAIIGIIVGGVTLFPLGIIAGPFLGAFVGEVIGGKKASEAARAGAGTVFGVVMVRVFHFIYSIVAASYFFVKLF